jgi:hypothetical protein
LRNQPRRIGGLTYGADGVKSWNESL